MFFFLCKIFYSAIKHSLWQLLTAFIRGLSILISSGFRLWSLMWLIIYVLPTKVMSSILTWLTMFLSLHSLSINACPWESVIYDNISEYQSYQTKTHLNNHHFGYFLKFLYLYIYTFIYSYKTISDSFIDWVKTALFNVKEHVEKFIVPVKGYRFIRLPIHIGTINGNLE